MTCPQINTSLQIKEDGMRTMLDTSLVLHCQVQTQISIFSLKLISIVGTQEHNSYKETSFRIPPRSTIAWYQQNNLLRQIPRMLKLLHYQLVFLSQRKTKLMYLLFFKQEEVTKTRPGPKIKEGTPSRVTLMDLTVFNPGDTINQRIILPEMSKIFICYPIKMYD